MNNQVYFEINGTASSIADIPIQFQIVFLSKKVKKTSSGTKAEVKFYALSSTCRLTAEEASRIELNSCRLRAAAPAVVREYLSTAANSNTFWRTQL